MGRNSASTFVFADIAGFTALTEAHGDDSAADLVVRFAERARARIADGDGEVVKSVGDALMMRFARTAPALEVACHLTGGDDPAGGMPLVRAGMHRGPAVRRADDWFGAAVNTAARISGLATGGEILLSAAAASDLPVHGRRDLSDRGVVKLRNVARPVRLFSVVPCRPPPLSVDPVCRMTVAPGAVAGVLNYDGRRFVFCSLTCAARFAAAPSRYAADPEEGLPEPDAV